MLVIQIYDHLYVLIKAWETACLVMKVGVGVAVGVAARVAARKAVKLAASLAAMVAVRGQRWWQ